MKKPPHTYSNIRDKGGYALLVELSIVRATLADLVQVLQRQLVHVLVCLHLVLHEGDPTLFGERDVGFLGRLDEEQRLSLLARTRRSTHTVDEKRGVLRGSVLNDPVDVRDVDAARSNVGAEQHAR